VTSFIVDAGFIGVASLRVRLSPGPLSGTTLTATLVVGTLAALSALATLSGSAPVVRAPWGKAGIASSSASAAETIRWVRFTVTSSDSGRRPLIRSPDGSPGTR
jgi:hypothetical protein